MTWWRIRILIYQKCKALIFEAFYFNASQHHMNYFYQNMPFINIKSSFILYNNNDGLSPHVRNKQSFWCSLNCCFRNFCLLYLSFWLIRDLIKCIRALSWYNIFKSVNVQKTLFSFYNRKRKIFSQNSPVLYWIWDWIFVLIIRIKRLWHFITWIDSGLSSIVQNIFCSTKCH